jgi:predicted hydrocarbon binding protein
MPEDRRYPNANLYVLILAVEEVLGKNGLALTLNQGGLSNLVGKYPPNNMDMEVPFSLYGKVQQAIEDFYGPRGSRAILLRVGRALFRYTLHERPALIGLASVALKALPTTARQKLILSQLVKASAENFNMPGELIETADTFIVNRTACPCQFRKRDPDEGFCDHVTAGTLYEAAKWATGKTFKVTQTKCLNTGDLLDEFTVSKTPEGEE